MKRRSAPLYEPCGSGRTFLYVAQHMLFDKLYNRSQQVEFRRQPARQVHTSMRCTGRDIASHADSDVLRRPYQARHRPGSLGPVGRDHISPVRCRSGGGGYGANTARAGVSFDL